MKKVLIISYTLPPDNGIGGRRWAKFAKVLKHKGYDIKVIAAQNITKDSPWTKDTLDYEDSIIRIPSKYPFFLGIIPKTIKDKLLYRLSLQKVKLTTKGNYYDKGAHWKIEIQKEVRRAITTGYENVVITVAPFKTALWVSELKVEFPDINFIVDFRDPWIEEILSKQASILSPKRQQFEIDSEQQIIERFDFVVSVAEQMTNNFIEKYNYLPKEKFKTIPNGYDPDEILENNKETSTNNSIVFAGTFYNDAIDKFLNLLKALKDISKESPDLLKQFRFVFYSHFDFEYKSLIKNLPITVNKPVSLDSIHVIIKNSKACMLFLSNDINYSLSTKFCEYVAYKKPVLVFSNKGYTSSFVTKNKIGFSINDNNLLEDLTKALIELKNKPFNSNFNYQQFSINSIIKDYEALLK